jgi:hypothetical protein
LFATLQARIIGGGVLLVLVLSLFLWGKGVLNERAELKDWQTSVLKATQVASGNPKLVRGDVESQIRHLGESLLNFKNQITVQNKAVDDLSVKRNEALAARDREAALRKEVIGKSQSLAQELRNSALTPVEREKRDAELRRVQDVAWEAGL